MDSRMHHRAHANTLSSLGWELHNARTLTMPGRTGCGRCVYSQLAGRHTRCSGRPELLPCGSAGQLCALTMASGAGCWLDATAFVQAKPTRPIIPFQASTLSLEFGKVRWDVLNTHTENKLYRQKCSSARCAWGVVIVAFALFDSRNCYDDSGADS